MGVTADMMTREEWHNAWRTERVMRQQAEARLAKVPALVEAAKWLSNAARSEVVNARTAQGLTNLRAALAAWENERPATPPGLTQGNATGPQLTAASENE